MSNAKVSKNVKMSKRMVSFFFHSSFQVSSKKAFGLQPFQPSYSGTADADHQWGL
jgi:hypothetical protein